MSISFTQNAVVSGPGQQYLLSQFLAVTSGTLPEYIVLTGLDVNRYTAASTGSVGSLTGNHATATFVENAQTNGAANIGAVFSYTDQGYYNQTLGYLNNINYTSSVENYRSEYLSLYGFGTAGTVNSQQQALLTTLTNSATLNPSMQFVEAPPAGGTVLGSLNIVTRLGYVDATPNVATPNEIAAVAASFVGKTWNVNGCWVLASDIAAAAGASLPVNSAVPRSLAVPGSNGQWIVAYDSTTATPAQQLTWQTRLMAGDIVDFDGYCGGHIVTVASGSGYGARMIDNAGPAAGDGSANDIIIEAAHGAADALSGALAQYVVIYRLDTPVVTTISPLSLKANASAPVAGYFSTQDPAGKPIVSYQFYDSGTGTAAGVFTIDGLIGSAHSADTALTVAAASLAGTTFSAGSGNDTIMVRGFNGANWGDWQSIPVLVGSGIQAPVVQLATDQTVVRVGSQVQLSSLVTVSSSESPVVSYTIVDPAGPTTGSGHISLNGAVNLLGTPANPSQDMTYQVSAADFAKLTYVGGGFLQNGEALTITATTAAQQTSMPAALQIMNVGLSGNGIAHYLAPGTTIPVSQMFSVTGVGSGSPIKFYIFSLDPALSDTLNLNGAVNLFGTTLSATDGWAHYEIAAADLGRVTFTAGANTQSHAKELLIAASDGQSTANAFSFDHGATTLPSVTPVGSGTVVIGNTVALASLLATGNDPTNQQVHIFDPDGGGRVNLNGATNLMGKEALTGEYIVAGSDLGKVTYTGGDGQENLLVATSGDGGVTWAPEVAVAVAGVISAPDAAGMNIQSAALPVRVTDSAANVAANLDGLGALAAAGKLSTISLSDGGAPALSLTPAQLSADTAALGAITGGFSLAISADAANITIDGLPGHATTAVFSGPAGSYSISSNHDGSMTLATGGSADHLSGITQLQFADKTMSVASAGTLSQYVALLYQGALGRTPDAAGLAAWQHYVGTLPTAAQAEGANGLWDPAVYDGAPSVAAGFVNSTEFQTRYGSLNNSQFINQLYANVLDRTPDATGLNAWITAMNGGVSQAQALVGFADSAEAVTNATVGYTGQSVHAAWLLLI